jgi:hypothetical protein
MNIENLGDPLEAAARHLVIDDLGGKVLDMWKEKQIAELTKQRNSMVFSGAPFALNGPVQAAFRIVQNERRRRAVVLGRRGGSLAMMELARLVADAGN